MDICQLRNEQLVTGQCKNEAWQGHDASRCTANERNKHSVVEKYPEGTIDPVEYQS